MIEFKFNSKLINLTDDQFLLIKQIASLGFVTKPQMNMLYSVIKGQQILISSHIIIKLVKAHVLSSLTTKDSGNRINRRIYTIGRAGKAMLSHYQCFIRDLKGFRINDHNYQSTETLIQALYASAFKQAALGSNNSALTFEDKKLNVIDSLENELIIPPFVTEIHQKSSFKPVVSRIHEESFNENVDISRAGELLAEEILVGGVIDKKLRLSLSIKDEEHFDPKNANDVRSWFDSDVSFFRKLRLSDKNSIYETFSHKMGIEDNGLRLGLTKVGGFSGRGRSLYWQNASKLPVLSSIKPVLNTIKYQFFRAKAQNTILLPVIYHVGAGIMP